jgi:hypothetical protein
MGEERNEYLDQVKWVLALAERMAVCDGGDTQAVRFSASLEQTEEHFEDRWHNWL